MGRLFGTDGIRGEANRYPMNAEIAFALGQAVVYTLKKDHTHPRVVIGKDTRISGYMLESSLESGITSMGGNPYLLGVLPTPGIAFVAHSMRADAGIVISASHNPYQDNGIKIFSGHGFKLSDEQEEAIDRVEKELKEISYARQDSHREEFRTHERNRCGDCEEEDHRDIQGKKGGRSGTRHGKLADRYV